MKFNQPLPTLRNYMGGRAYRLTPEMELYTTVVSTMLDNTYYEKADQRLERIRALIPQVAPQFVARLAVYTRTQMYLRTVPLVLVVELAKIHCGDDLLRRTVARVVQRPDEITELLAYYQRANDRQGTKQLNRLSKQLQRGLADAFNRFDGYQLAKYNRAGQVTLRDALFLVHPKAKDLAQQLLFDQLTADTLPTPYTWETELSALGQQHFDTETLRLHAKAARWEELVESGKMGYMALLRNLRNLIQQATPVTVQKVLTVLTEPTRVHNARQVPFRYLSAYAEVQKLKQEENLTPAQDALITQTLAALETAVSVAVDNLPALRGRTLILTDNSGSMRGDAGGSSAVSAMSRRSTADIANLFAVLCGLKMEATEIGLFGDRLVIPTLDRTQGVFTNFAHVSQAGATCGPSTEQGIFEMMERLIQEQIHVDRILIFSDCQIGTGCNWFGRRGHRADDFNRLFRKYRNWNPAVMTYSIDLRGYGNTLFQEGVVTIGGWSEKIFDLMVAAERGSDVVAEINQIDV
ncbi:TROVE domain-containing protein [Catalinimonas alkaloidigena]|uniref:TROVE domain-containing protein n=1 Tax=Catalinimonas alkaloidigena TaxID=1075417 RepID=A0A1G9AF85_9BACT|nr:TROVE domain-containing protein [Catalinimonas alkaloidigena]SDK26006.1 TROVE domain-containing protein [Catalinimonas alkaloidigena]